MSFWCTLCHIVSNMTYFIANYEKRISIKVKNIDHYDSSPHLGSVCLYKSLIDFSMIYLSLQFHLIKAKYRIGLVEE